MKFGDDPLLLLLKVTLGKHLFKVNNKNITDAFMDLVLLPLMLTVSKYKFIFLYQKSMEVFYPKIICEKKY